MDSSHYGAHARRGSVGTTQLFDNIVSGSNCTCLRLLLTSDADWNQSTAMRWTDCANAL
jgi:hypothetical protein